ncbi:hypothetical protein HK096_003168, partial [Nowakowskiella sp. JEL0078]
MDRCRSLKLDHELDLRLLSVSANRISLLPNITPTNTTSSSTGAGSVGNGEKRSYADDVLLDEVLLEAVRCLKTIMNDDSGFEAVTAQPAVLRQVCLCFCVDSDIAQRGVIELMGSPTEGEWKDISDAEVEEEGWVVDNKKRNAYLTLRTLCAEVLGPALLLADEQSAVIYKLVLDSFEEMATMQNEEARFVYLIMSLLDPYSPQSVTDTEAFLEKYLEARVALEERRAHFEGRKRQALQRRVSEISSEEDFTEEEDVMDTNDDNDDGDEAEEYEDFENHDERETKEWEYREAILVFVNNALLDPEAALEDRCRLRAELEERGLRKVLQILHEMNPPDTVAEQIDFFEEDRSEDSARIEEIYREKNSQLLDPIETVNQLLDVLHSLPDSERLTNYLTTILSHVRDVIKLHSYATKDQSMTKTKTTPLEAQAASSAIAEALLLLQTATSAVTQNVTAWRHRDTLLLETKRGDEKSVKARYQSMATDIVRGLEGVAGSEIVLTSLTTPGSGMLGGLTQQLQELQEKYNKAVEEVIAHKKEIDHLRRTLQFSTTNSNSDKAMISPQTRIVFNEPMRSSYYDSALVDASAEKLWAEIRRLEDLVSVLRRAREKEAATKESLGALQNDELERIDQLLKMMVKEEPKESSSSSLPLQVTLTTQEGKEVVGADLWKNPPGENGAGKGPESGDIPEMGTDASLLLGTELEPLPPPPPPPLTIAVPKLEFVMPKPRRAMKNLQWVKLDQDSVATSVWKDVATEVYKNSNGIASHLYMDENEVDELFGKNEVPETPKKAVVVKEMKKRGKRVLIDPKKAKSLGILLVFISKRLQSKPMSVLRDEIVTTEIQYLTVDMLESIEQYWPEDNDVKKVLQFEGRLDELGEADQFIKMVGDVPRMVPRLQSL